VEDAKFSTGLIKKYFEQTKKPFEKKKGETGEIKNSHTKFESIDYLLRINKSKTHTIDPKKVKVAYLLIDPEQQTFKKDSETSISFYQFEIKYVEDAKFSTGLIKKYFEQTKMPFEKKKPIEEMEVDLDEDQF
jgi:hypothetical protein